MTEYLNPLIRIRLEFGDAPSNVIRSFADDRYSTRTTAGALGISRDTLQKLCKRFGIQFHGKPEGWPVGRPKSKPPWNSLAKGARYSDEEIFAAIRQCPHARKYKKAKMRPNISLIYERFGSFRVAKERAMRDERHDPGAGGTITLGE